ncbi:MAG TPA: hypothetical protein VGR53_08880 [Nitrososphaerales archaeon]|nr:hypothetical protein [Nitrososphaerales archaeon]
MEGKSIQLITKRALDELLPVSQISATSSHSHDVERLLAVESVLNTVFGSAGSQVLMKEVSERYGLTTADALERPDAFKFALVSMVGEVGSSVVMGRINKRAWGNPDHPSSSEDRLF